MTEQQRALVAVSAVIGGDRSVLTEALRVAASVCDPVAVEETLLQSFLFRGYPAALGALAEWRRVSGRSAPVPGEPGVESDRVDPAAWAVRGEQTCGRVYGGQYGRLRGNIRALHPDMEQWMVTEGYGRVLGRPGLELATRELCIVGLLAGQDAAPQLYSHLRGALNAGATAETVDAVVAVLAEGLPAQRRETLRAQWAAVRQRRDGEN
jgi:4-carboxymuconolactone decarboxylase